MLWFDPQIDPLIRTTTPKASAGSDPPLLPTLKRLLGLLGCPSAHRRTEKVSTSPTAQQCRSLD